MRYADLAYQHIQSSAKDPNRTNILDEKARQSGFSNAPDYIDHLQGKSDTYSFTGANNRVCWVNEDAKIYGWNNRQDPIQSTVIYARKAGHEFENHREQQAKELGLQQIPLKGPLSEQERTVPQQSLAVTPPAPAQPVRPLPSSAEPAPAPKSVADYQRGDDQAHSRQKQDDEKRPSEQPVDRYRRSPGRDDGKDR